MRPRLALIALALVGLVPGCGAVSGDGTWGEEDRSLWRIDDGLCPGTEGGCAMEVPVAAGAQIAVDANVPCAERRRASGGGYTSDCDLASLDVVASGAAELRSTSYDPNDARIDIEVLTVGEGEGVLELLRADESRFDRITFDVRAAVAMECGHVGSRGAAWDMPSLDGRTSYTVASSGADRVTELELGCRLLDDRGLPLFSAATISWRITEGADISRIDDGGLFGGDRSTGARIYAHFEGRGTIRLEATFGELTREIEIVVE